MASLILASVIMANTYYSRGCTIKIVICLDSYLEFDSEYNSRSDILTTLR